MNTETMNLDYVRTFVKVGQSNTVAEACKKIGLSQSNVSRQIKQLEGALQVKLTENVRGKIVLTKDGETLFKIYEEAYNKIMYAEKMIIQNRSVNSGKISIGCIDGLDTTFLNPQIEIFYQKYSNLVFKVLNGTQDELEKDLSSYKVDFIIGLKGNYKKSDNFTEKKIATLGYSLISKDNNFDLNNIPLILPSSNTYSRNKANQFFEENGIRPKIFLELNENNSIIDCVKKGMGIGFVPTVVANNVKDLNSYALPSKYEDDLYIAYDNKLLAKTAKEFINMIIEKK